MAPAAIPPETKARILGRRRPPPPARPRPSMALIALFTFQPRPPVRPPKSLTHNPLNATASSFAPKRRRKWVQASRMRSLGVVRLAGTKVCARAPWRPESGAHQPREPNCGGGCVAWTRGARKWGPSPPELAPATTTTTRHEEAAPALRHKTRRPYEMHKNVSFSWWWRRRSRGQRTGTHMHPEG